MLDLPQPDPNFNRLLKVLLRQGEPDRVPFVETSHDPEIMEALLPHLPGEDGSDERERPWRRRLRFWRQLGYDYISLGAAYPLSFPWETAENTAALGGERRGWISESKGLIETREDFARYPWPDLSQPPDLSAFEITAKYLPEGMKIISHTGGVLHYVMVIMGYAPFALALMDDPALVADIFQKVGEMLLRIHREFAGMEAVGALSLGDDMGFKHATMISPAALRQYVFPWQKKLAEIAHAAGKPFLLHSCGNLEEVMEDLIEEVGIDGKHSFEDVIMPVGEAKRRWGNRLAMLGGIDMDFLCRSTPEQVRAYVRRTLEECMPGGGYALGTGNTAANYVPVENFLAMLEAGREFGRYSSQ